MNIVLWILQVLIALHTAIGAVWKLSNPAQGIPSLEALPPALWLTLAGIELLCAVALLAPLAMRGLDAWVPIAAGVIALEMLLFSALHLGSGAEEHGPMIYWIGVAVLCAALAWGRAKIAPIRAGA